MRRPVCASLLAVLAGALLAAPAAGAAPAGLRLPAPTGTSLVGVRSAFVLDPSRPEPGGRPRAIPLRVWYPARPGAAGPAAPYLAPAIQAVVEQALSLPAGAFTVATGALERATPRRVIRGIVLASPGGTLVALQSAQALDLASRGWVVVAMDHPHESLAVAQPDGSLIFGDLPEDASFPQRLLDVDVVLDHLRTVVPGWRRGLPVAMFGHSMGGAAAAQMLHRDARLDAGVDLDGTPRGTVVDAGLDRPFGVMLSQGHTRASDVFLDRLLTHLRGPHAVEREPIEHYGYTDFVVLNPEAFRLDPALGAALEGQLTTGVGRDLALGLALERRQRRFLAGVFRLA